MLLASQGVLRKWTFLRLGCGDGEKPYSFSEGIHTTRFEYHTGVVCVVHAMDVRVERGTATCTFEQTNRS